MQPYVFRAQTNAFPYAMYLSFLNDHPDVNKQFKDRGVTLSKRGPVAYLTEYGFLSDPPQVGHLFVHAAMRSHKIGIEQGFERIVKNQYVQINDVGLNIIKRWGGDGQGLGQAILTLDEYLDFCRKKEYDPIVVVDNDLWKKDNEFITRLSEIKKGEIIDLSLDDLVYWKPCFSAIIEGPPHPKKLVSMKEVEVN